YQGNLSITRYNMLLNLHSHYSLRYGTYSIRQLIEGMKQNGYDTAVLTDINNSTASLDFIRECRAAGLTGLAGMEYRSGDRLLYIGIAQNERGFKELNDFITEANRKGTPLPARAPEFSDAFVIYPYGQYQEALRDHEYLGVRPRDLNRFRMDKSVAPGRCVVLQTVSYPPADFKFHTQLRAVDHYLLISQLQPDHTGGPDEVFLPRENLLNLFRDCPCLIANTEKLLAQCGFSFSIK